MTKETDGVMIYLMRVDQLECSTDLSNDPHQLPMLDTS